MRIVAANEEDLEDKVQERTQGDGTRLRADDSDAFIVCIVEEAELPTATKY